MPNTPRHDGQCHDEIERFLRNLTRRRFFASAAGSIGAGVGMLALDSLNVRAAFANDGPLTEAEVLAQARVIAPKAKRVIAMHMEGAPSQLDLFDYKPDLSKRYDEDLPDSVRNGQRITGMTSGQARFPVAPSIFRFDHCPTDAGGMWISELLPHTQKVANELCVIRSMHTNAINHEPGITFFQTGFEQPGRPSVGAWASYGLGSLSNDLPSFVVLITQGIGNMQALGARFWGSGFLPSQHQGCRFRAGKDAVLYLRDPDGVARQDRRHMLDLLARVNQEEFARSLDPETQARIEQHEMAYRMQMSVPELTDLSAEPKEVLDLYGPDVTTAGSFSANCLLARRLAERGVRFIQLYMRGWDQHNNLPEELRAQCKAVDQGQAALIQDLRNRGMLDETLILWAGEFGRTAYSQGTLTKSNYGRDHHPRCFSVFLAGGGIKGGMVYGSTDDYSYNIVENPVEVHDLHATMLHLLGLDHSKLTYRQSGRDFRLTDLAGHKIDAILT
ncbi:MAG: DUF1501 domain-containing protein [Planctomycetota bacterium]|nr:DUF1501 domain-containing protein [Planctomycetota bacterium]